MSRVWLTMAVLATIFAVLVPQLADAQCHSKRKIKKGNFREIEGEPNFTDEEIIPTSYPMYPGGLEGLFHDVLSNVEYPDFAMENEIEGKVYVGFIVGKDGGIENVEVLSSTDRVLNDAALDAVRYMQEWLPGCLDDEPLAVSFTLPVRFALE